MNSVAIVHAFWDEVWNAHDPSAVDGFVVDDFVIVTGGETIAGRENFKRPAPRGDRVVSERRLVSERRRQPRRLTVAADRQNNGFFGTEPDQQDIAMTGTAVLAVNDDGKLLTNWVERASLKQFQRLTGAGK
ncbi:MAG TPA: ester cyclase [Mycobacterium sp.]|nr:ester cyclase [Mycobacterium sp.]